MACFRFTRLVTRDTWPPIQLTRDWIGERTPFGIDGAALYPLFTPDIIDLMRELLPPERQDRVAISVIATARKT